VNEVENKNDEIMRASRQISKLRNEASNQETVREGIRREFETVVNKLNIDVTLLKDEIQSYEDEIQKLQSSIRMLKTR
jgi:ribosome recycling factor